MLEVEHLSIESSSKSILKEVSLSLTEKEAISIVGESGSGKSTLLKSLLGFPLGGLKKTGGHIRFEDTVIEPQQKRQKLPFLGSDLAWVSQHATVSFNNRRKIKAHYRDLLKSYKGKVEDLRTLEEALDLVDFKNPE